MYIYFVYYDLHNSLDVQLNSAHPKMRVPYLQIIVSFESHRPRNFAAPHAPAGGAAFWRPAPLPTLETVWKIRTRWPLFLVIFSPIFDPFGSAMIGACEVHLRQCLLGMQGYTPLHLLGRSNPASARNSASALRDGGPAAAAESSVPVIS